MPQIVGPYLQDYLRRCGGSQSRLGLSVCDRGRNIEWNVGDVGGLDLSTLVRERIAPFAVIAIEPDRGPGDLSEILDLIAHTLREETVYLYTLHPAAVKMSARLPTYNT